MMAVSGAESCRPPVRTAAAAAAAGGGGGERARLAVIAAGCMFECDRLDPLVLVSLRRSPRRNAGGLESRGKAEGL